MKKKKKVKRVLNPKIVEAKDKCVDVVKGIDASKVATTVVGGVITAVITKNIKKD